MYETRNETTNLPGPDARHARSPLLDSASAASSPGSVRVLPRIKSLSGVGSLGFTCVRAAG